MDPVQKAISKVEYSVTNQFIIFTIDPACSQQTAEVHPEADLGE